MHQVGDLTDWLTHKGKTHFWHVKANTIAPKASSPKFLLYGYTFMLVAKLDNTGLLSFLHLVLGANDDHLPWPCEFTCTFALMNPKHDKDHRSFTRDYSTSKPAATSYADGIRLAGAQELKAYTDDAGYVTLRVNVKMKKSWRFQ